MKLIQRLSMLAVTCLLLVGCAGCDKPTNPTTIKTISQQAGMWSAVGWIALDNPAPDQIAVVLGLMDQVESVSTNVVAGKTYTQVVYPAVAAYIDASVEIQYRPLAKTGVLSALNALDLLFAMYPEWRTDEQLAHEVVQAFILGARGGLSMKEADPVMRQARHQGAIRVYIFREARAAKLEAEALKLKGGSPDGR
jgi:hypothetical protein